MHFADTEISGVYVIALEPMTDDRGFFARAFCADEFNRRGMLATTAQCNLSFNPKAGTVRGFHYLLAPAREAKLIRCIRGRVYDVIVDTRLDSPTYLRHIAVELSAENRRAVYIPPGMAHAYQTLADDSEVFYQVTDTYVASMERGLRFDDPQLAIAWPLPVTLVSEKDRGWPLLDPNARRELPRLSVSITLPDSIAPIAQRITSRSAE